VGVDWPNEAEEPSEKNSTPSDSQTGDRRAVPAEPRSRQEQYASQHEAVSAQKSATARQEAADEQAAAEKWDKSAKKFRWMWGEYQRRWPPDERPTETQSGVSQDRSRPSNERLYQELEIACDRIARRERETISPMMREIESRDSSRCLVGFKHRLKDSDRIMEKTVGRIEEKNRTPEEAVSLIPDAIRYTFEYNGKQYAQGVWEDIARLKEHGFELVKCKNFWSGEQYKGINSQWIEPGTGQRFEVQFHTRISFEAKQLTHGAYERLRSEGHDEFERMVLKAFQREVSAEVPSPPGATGIPDYPERGQNAR
jgi:hypothetical protein